jgi:hypothetical protein
MRSLLLLLTVLSLAAENTTACGGGWMDAGIQAAYFPNPDLTGEPAFVRREVRIRCDWGPERPVGGSRSEPYRSFPAQGFSVRFTGRLLPRFTESYTFALDATGAPTLRVRPAGGAWAVVTGPVALRAGEPCDLELVFRHATGPARVALAWESASTPREVIAPVVDQGLNLASWDKSLLADRGAAGRYWRILGKEPTDSGIDEHGWPLHDCEFIPFEASKGVRGTYLVSFHGKAALAMHLMKAVFTIDGKETGVKPRDVGYDAATNTTTFPMRVESDEGTAFLKITETSRSGGPADNSGITDLRIMLPLTPGGTETHRADELYYRPLKPLVETFTTLRWLQMANAKAHTAWSGRTRPGYRALTRSAAKGELDPGENLEKLIMFANETGRDLWICTPIAADDAWFERLARLVQFGSDGDEPYAAPQVAPVYPPLNANLCVYVEVGNEIWNWIFASTQQGMEAAWQEVERKTPDGLAVNYDQTLDKASIFSLRRWHALRTVRACQAFRRVCGDVGFGQRFRPVLEYQYANAQQSAVISFAFLDAWFNNGTGANVPDPRPVAHWIWGGGGAGYYGVGNGDGVQENVRLADPGFEAQMVAEGGAVVAPTGAWTATGTAGIFRPFHALLPAHASAKPIKANAKTAVGLTFTVGDRPVFVHRVGRAFTRACDGARVRIQRADDGRIVAEGDTGRIAAFMTHIFGYYWAKPFETPVQLDPGITYHVLALSNGGDVLSAADEEPAAGLGPGVTLVGAAKAQVADPAGAWQVTPGKAGSAFGPVGFLYTFDAGLRSELPQPPEGQQGGLLRGKGVLETEVEFPAAGRFAFTFHATGKNPFQIWVDDQHASARAQTDHRAPPATANCGIGGWGRNNGFKEEWGSAVFEIAQPGKHRLRLVGTGRDEKEFVVFDDIRIRSLDAIMQSGFGGGSALGQPVQAKWGDGQRTDTALVAAFGLPRMSYEHGWSLGGDFYQKPIQNYAKLCDPRAEAINDEAVAIFNRAGGGMAVWGVYTYWAADDFAGGRTTPIMQSFIAASNRLPVASDNGVAVPGELNAGNAIAWQGKPKAELAKRGAWLSWTFVVAEAGTYRIAPEASGAIEVELDGRAIDPAQAVRLRAGLHGLRVRSRSDAAVTLTRVQVSR